MTEIVSRETLIRCHCGAFHSRIGQRYCHACHAEAQRRYRAKRKKESRRLYSQLTVAMKMLRDVEPIT